jgi:hypothetical protein
MRRAISFCVATAMLLSGTYMLPIYVVGVGDIALPARLHGFILMGCAMLIGLGGRWLWADFLGPALGIKVED